MSKIRSRIYGTHSNYSLVIFVAGVALCLVVTSLWQPMARGLIILHEEVSLFFDPSVERMFAYGSVHIDKSHSLRYDMRRAEELFIRAAQVDSRYPYLNHQLARVNFLRGKFEAALFYIDREIDFYGNDHANAYYVRGLIEGFMGRYEDAVRDYAHYLDIVEHDSWAAINDYAWVLLKAKRHREAAEAAEDGLRQFPGNAWLLNTSAVAHYEIGEYGVARQRAARAIEESKKVTNQEWLEAYPGNDPRIAGEGVATLHEAAVANMYKAEVALEKMEVERRAEGYTQLRGDIADGALQ